MLDIARDPRWGRISEGAGEDPYLGAAMARAQVRGFQGTPENPRPIHGNVEAFRGLRSRGRRQGLRRRVYSGGADAECVSAPFRAGVRRAREL